MSTIITKNSSTASAVPTPADLEQGELAVNVTDKRLFTENSSGSVVELGTNPTSITTGAITATGADIGNLTLGSGSITDSSGSITFGNENISTTGTFASGTITVTGNISVSGTVDGRDIATDGAKLDNIEANADVTDATNVDAAGAVMNTDTSTASMSFVIDEDAMGSNSATKVPTQQSVKAYVDSTVIAIGAVTVDPTPVANDFAKFTNSTELTGRSYAEVRADLSLEVGTDVQAYDSNLTDFVNTFTLPTVDGTSGQALTTNGGGTIGFTTIESDPTLGTLDQTFTASQQATITLSSAVTSGVPNVSVTKEVPQVGVTNNSWDVTGSAYTLEDSAYATTLDFDFNVSGASFVNSFSVSSQETSSQDMAFNSDGTKMFVVGLDGQDVNEYLLSSAFDVSTASYSQSFSVSTQETSPRGITFNTDGTKMYIVGTAGVDVNEYTLSTGFDVSTSSYSQNFSVSAQETAPYGIAFNTDGTKMFIVGATGDEVNEYTLSTGFDISTATYSQNFSVSAQDGVPQGIAFNSDGTKMFIVGSNGDNVYQYTLSTGFDVSTATYSQSFSVAAQEILPTGIAFSTDDTKMFVVGSNGDNVNEYTITPNLSLGTGSFASADVGKTIEANSGVFILTSTAGAVSQTTAPTSYDQVASGDWSMYAIVYDSANDRLELSGVVEDQFDISTASFVDSFSVSAQETGPTGIAFNTDGTKMFIVGASGDDVNEYTLGTGFDVSTASYSQNFSVSAQETIPNGIAFNTDGTKMFIVGQTGDDVNEYTLSTGFDISTATYSQNFSVSAQETVPQGIAFNTDGTKMFIVGTSGDAVYEYTLGTGFDVSTASFVDSFSVSAQETTPTGIAFNTDGTKMFIVGQSGQDVNEYTLATGFDVSTATYSQNFSVSAQEGGPTGIAFNTDGTKMFIVGTTGDEVNEYIVGTFSAPSQYQPAFSPNIDTTYWTDLNSTTVTDAVNDGALYYAISDDNRTTWSVLDSSGTVRDIARDNAGTWEYNSNSTYGSETWTSATSNTEIQALRDAMGVNVVTDKFNVSTAVYSQNFSVSAQEIDPSGIAFNADGTKMFIVGSSGDDVNEYTLSTGFDVSTATYSQNFSVSAQEVVPLGIAFNSDGTKMFIVGSDGDDVNEYTLGTGFDVSTASYSQNFSVSAQETSPTDIAFNTDGTKMFIVGSSGDDVNEYTLGTGFDVSTASYSQNFSVSAQETGPQGITFNTDGTKMFIVGATGDDVNEYTLGTGFDVSTASYSQNFSVSAQEIQPSGIAFNNDGTKMFILGESGDDVNEYTVGTTTFANQMTKATLNALTDAQQITLTNDLDFAAIFYLASGTTVPTYSGTALNYDANTLNEGAVLGTDYDWDFPANDKVRITALSAGNYKVRVV